MNEQLLKTSGADVLSSKIKTLVGVGYILWVVALLEVCDVTKNGQVRTVRIHIVCA